MSCSALFHYATAVVLNVAANDAQGGLCLENSLAISSADLNLHWSNWLTRRPVYQTQNKGVGLPFLFIVAPWEDMWFTSP